MWNDALETYFQELKRMVCVDMLLSYSDWKIPFIFHTDESDKQIGAVIIQNNKPIAFFSTISRTPQHNYTMNEKEMLVVVECLKQCRVILFDNEINALSYYKNLFYVTASLLHD